MRPDGARVAGQGAGKLVARGDVEFEEDLAQVVLDGARAYEQPRADPGVGDARRERAARRGSLARSAAGWSRRCVCGRFRRWPAVRGGPARRTPPCPSCQACRERCAAAHARRRGAARVGATRRRAEPRAS
jgi:hypothetical protein